METDGCYTVSVFVTVFGESRCHVRGCRKPVLLYCRTHHVSMCSDHRYEHVRPSKPRDSRPTVV